MNKDKNYFLRETRSIKLENISKTFLLSMTEALIRPTFQIGRLWLCQRLQKHCPWSLASVFRSIFLGSFNRQHHFHSFRWHFPLVVKGTLRIWHFALDFLDKYQSTSIDPCWSQELRKRPENKIAPNWLEHDDLTITYILG